MNKLVKKSIAIFICSLFIISAVTISSAATIKKEETITSEENLSTETISPVKEITLYRYGPDGIITQKKVMIKLEKEQDLGEAIVNKCDELMENDIEIQNLIKTAEDNETRMLAKIWSVGRGFHFKTKIRLQMVKRIKLFQFLPPYFRTAIFIPTNFCKYSKDPKAKTVITPLSIGSIKFGENLTIDGPHSVLTIGFIGYSGWIGHISYFGFIMRTGFVGFTVLASCKKL